MECSSLEPQVCLGEIIRSELSVVVTIVKGQEMFQ